MTRTSRTGKCSKKQGFTLLELAVVIFIISLFFTLAVPAFRNRTSDSDALKVASVLRELNESSIARKADYDITFDMDRRLADWNGPEGPRSMELKGLTAVDMPSRGMVKEGTLKILFDAMGAPEDITVYLSGEKNGYKVSLVQLSGRVIINGTQ
ncbi:MAG: prepilin-type N-terminal cleavage/methylation domain-containing protein [Nitrospiraceae bacterium]|nr:prepilin-type N-terminal cleavage/methylation domain-containing protein [Nitrospiraceae bacterium]